MDWDDIEERLIEIGETLDRPRRIEAFTDLLATLRPGQTGWAETLMDLAEDLTSERRFDEARQRYQEALDDGGPTTIHPLAGLLNLALDEDDAQAVDDLVKRLLVVVRAESLSRGNHQYIGESLELAGRLRPALRWYSIPLWDVDPGDLDRSDLGLLSGRSRVREQLGLPRDSFDLARDELLRD